MKDNLVLQLKNMLKQIFPDAKEIKGGTSLTINCPLCNQSGDPDKGHHMYINLGMNDKPPMFNCFRRTGHSGLLTISSLRRLSEDSQYLDTDLMEQIENYFHMTSGLTRNKGNYKPNYVLNVNNQLNDEEVGRKLYYMSKRIGYQFTLEELTKNKITIDLLSFLKMNNINHFTRDYRTLELLSKYFIGFVTNTNTSIILRNTLVHLTKCTGIKAMRYVKYNIIENEETSYYIIPSQCDLTKHIKIHIAEGTYDILSVFYNLQNQNRVNNIYAAIGSKAYLNLISYFLGNLGLIDVEFHVYIDNGIEQKIIWDIKRLISPIHTVYIHINTYPKEKDFGVPLSNIRDYHYKL